MGAPAETSEIDIPAAWRQAAEQILAHGWRRVMVIGAADRGKSTFCNILSSLLLQAGAKVAFVDGDIGQKDVGPPATISLAYAQSNLTLSALPAHALYFIGAVNPSAHFITMIIGTQRMVEQAEGDYVIVDTTGHVTGRGKTLKALLCEALRPDIIVMLEKEEELSGIYRAHRHLNIIRLPPSSLAKGKSPSMRRAARQKAFADYFASAMELNFELSQLVFQRTLLFTGKPIADLRYLHTEQNDEGILAVSKKMTNISERGLKVVPRNFAERLLSSVSDGHGKCLGLAIIQHIDFAAGRITIFTPVEKRSVEALQLGDLYLDQKGKELEHQRRGHF